ncbi:MAG: hypothetical protein L6Q45_17070, partial [Anaerolineales bacterium]|nr:hypothetical protein [Anaerolineales bacterium]
AAEEMGKLNLVLDTDYTLAPDENGNLAAFNKAGVKIYEPSTNLWNSNLIAKIVENSLKITGDCEKTDLSPSGDFLKINRHGLKMQSELTELGASPRIDHLHFQFLFLRSPSNRAQNQFCWMFTLSYPEDPPERPFIAFWRTEAGGETQIHWADLFNPEE